MMNCDEQPEEILPVAQDLYRAFFRVMYAGTLYAFSIFISRDAKNLYGGAVRYKNRPMGGTLIYGEWIDMLPDYQLPPDLRMMISFKLKELCKKTDWDSL